MFLARGPKLAHSVCQGNIILQVLGSKLPARRSCCAHQQSTKPSSPDATGAGSCSTAIPASAAIVQWAAQHGLPEWICTDGGSHFKNQCLRTLCQRMRVQHHISTAYAPWANGAVERANRELLWVLRALCSEWRMNPDDWDYLLPVVEYALNHRNLPSLAGKTPIEVMTGKGNLDMN